MTYSAEVLADSPLAYWRLGEPSGSTLVDSSGNGRDGAYTVAPTLGVTGLLSSDSNTAANFNGSSHYASVADGAWMDVGTVTVEAWVKPDSATPDEAAWIIAIRDNGTFADANVRSWQLRLRNTGKFELVFWASDGGAQQTLAGTTTVSAGSTYHVVGTYDGTTARIYVNGTEENTLSASGAIPTSAEPSPIVIGRNASSSVFFFDGTIDEVAVYSGALSSGRIAAHYAAGTAAASNNATIAGSFPAWTGNIAATPVHQGTLTGNIPAWTGTIDTELTIEGTVAGDLPLWTGDIDAEVTVPSVEVELTGNIPAWTGTIAVQLPVGVEAEGDLPLWTGAFTVEVNALDLELAGDWPLWEGELAGTIIPSTNVHNRNSGRHRRSRATASWSPAVVEPPIVVHAYDVAIAFSTPTFTDGRPSYTVTEARKIAHRDRIVVGGKDVTFFRGVAPVFEFRLIQPLSYGSATLEFPQIFPVFEELGAGELSWLRPDAVVKIQRVDNDPDSETYGEVVAEDYRGIITKLDVRGKSLAVTIGGEIAGRAADRIKPTPVVHRRKDGGNLLADLVRPVALRPLSPRFGPDTGIDLKTFGGMGWLEAINQTVSMLTTRGGAQRTVVLDETSQRWTFPFKDRETIHATAYFDDARLEPDLARDTAEEPNRIYATGIDDEGRKVKFAVYPGLIQGDRPDFPNSGGTPIQPGDTDDDTDSGDGVSVMMHRLIAVGYLDRRDSGNMLYDNSTEEGIKDLQDDAGLSQTGIMNPATWRKLWDLDATGYSLKDAKILPAAQRSYTKPWLRTSSGALAARNPDFDPHRRKVDRQVDMGPGHSRHQIKSWARGLLASNEANWIGTLNCHISLIAGQHDPGDPLTADDVMSPREIRPGMNVWAPLFDGGTLFHVVGVGVNGNDVQLTLDTQARDTMHAWEAINRNRESRRSSARAWLDQYRSSRSEKDALITWDPIGGTIDDRVFCPGGRWTVFPVVAGQAGTVEKVRIETVNDEAEFAMAVFGRSIRERRLNHLAPNPLTEAGAEKWAENQDKLEDRLILYASGTHDQPLGYFPRAKTDEEGEPSGHPITGVHQDNASFSFHTFKEPVLYVAIHPDRDTHIRAGRIMWNQLEEGS